MTAGALDHELGVGTLPVLVGDGDRVLLIDQRKLPGQTEYFDATKFDDMLLAIGDMVVRGAPSIGVAAAFGLAWEADRIAMRVSDKKQFLLELSEQGKKLKETRPTAVNLAWAVELIEKKARTLIDAGSLDTKEVAAELKKLATEELDHHIDRNRTLSELGAELVPQDAQILTHCNAGSLATCGWGTALGVIRSAHLHGRKVSVFVDETRPRNQGAKLTMWELAQDRIPATLVCDSMAGHLMKSGKVNMVITGADRIAVNGDSANKIGTYNLAVLAKFHGIPFYIAAPLSTIDPTLESGAGIPIEHRDESEITTMHDRSITIDGARAFNPAFDVTPHELIAAIITEAGVLRADFTKSIGAALKLQG